MEDILQSGEYESPLDCNNVDWLVIEVIKSGNKMAFYLKNNEKSIIIPAKDEELYREKVIRRFCEKNIESDKVRDHCHLTRKYRGPAPSKCKVKLQRNKVFLYHLHFTISVFMSVIYFLKSSLRKK